MDAAGIRYGRAFTRCGEVTIDDPAASAAEGGAAISPVAAARGLPRRRARRR